MARIPAALPPRAERVRPGYGKGARRGVDGVGGGEERGVAVECECTVAAALGCEGEQQQRRRRGECDGEFEVAHGRVERFDGNVRAGAVPDERREVAAASEREAEGRQRLGRAVAVAEREREVVGRTRVVGVERERASGGYRTTVTRRVSTAARPPTVASARTT